VLEEEILVQIIHYQLKLAISKYMEININDLIKQIQKRINPSTFKKAVISKVNIQSSSADVYFIENPQNIIRSVPFSSAIDPKRVSVGNRCRVDMFDETNPSDTVIAYIYGGTTSSAAQFSTGTATVTTSGVTIAHGLGTVPSFVGTTPQSSTMQDVARTAVDPQGGTINYNDETPISVYEYASPDSTNIYLKSTYTSMSIKWIAIKF